MQSISIQIFKKKREKEKEEISAVDAAMLKLRKKNIISSQSECKVKSNTIKIKMSTMSTELQHQPPTIKTYM